MTKQPNSPTPNLQDVEKQVAAAEAAVTQAQEVVADLEAKRTAAVQHGTELADDRANVALAAHTGDDKAAARLKEIHQAIAMHGSELASLDAALRAAGTKVEHAKASLAIELQKLDAVKLRTASKQFVAQLKKMDATLDAFVNCLYDVEPIRQELDRLGVGPTFTQFLALGERPILLALSDTIFEGRDLSRILAPGERITFTQLAEAWTRGHDAAVSRILGEQTNNEEAA
jgi:hypothetical protein